MAEKELACLDPLLKDLRNLLGPGKGGYGGSLDGLAIDLYGPAFQRRIAYLSKALGPSMRIVLAIVDNLGKDFFIGNTSVSG